MPRSRENSSNGNASREQPPCVQPCALPPLRAQHQQPPSQPCEQQSLLLRPPSSWPDKRRRPSEQPSPPAPLSEQPPPPAKGSGPLYIPDLSGSQTLGCER